MNSKSIEEILKDYEKRISQLEKIINSQKNVNNKWQENEQKINDLKKLLFVF